MPKDKKDREEYPKPGGNDKRWKQQDEFDSAGLQRQEEDEDKNASIPDRNPGDNTERRDENG